MRQRHGTILLASLILLTAGAGAVRAAEPMDPNVGVSVVISILEIDHYEITATSPQTAGTGWTETITARDGGGGIVNLDRTVNLSSSGNAVFYTDASYATPTTTASLTAGTATLYVRDTTAETMTLQASDAFGKSGASGNILVNPGPIERYTISGTSPQTTGIGWTEALAAYDAYDNPVTTDNTTVVFLSSSGNAAYYADGTYSTAVTSVTLNNGVATLHVRDEVAETMTLLATDANGKSGTSPPITVESQYSPLELNAWADPPGVVAGETVALNCVASGGTGTYVSYVWSGPEDFQSTAQNPTEVRPPGLGTHVYDVTVTDSDGNTATAQVTVTAVDSTLEVVAEAQPRIVELGSGFHLSCVARGGSGTYVSYEWTGPDGFSSTEQAPGEVIAGQNGRQVYTVTVTDSAGLKATARVEVLVGEELDWQYAEMARTKYRVWSGSTEARARDYIRFKAEGVELSEGDRLAVSFNGVEIGDLTKGDGLELDRKLRARGSLGSSPHVFSRCVARYQAKKSSLKFLAAKGVAPSGGKPLVQVNSGLSDVIHVVVLVDRAPADGAVDDVILIPMVLKVKMMTARDGDTLEMGKQVRRER